MEGVPGVSGALNRWSTQKGGLWVGGRVTLREAILEFAPNAINRVAHADANALGLALQLVDVEAVEVRGGFPMKTIEVGTAEQLMRIRWYGATKFANLSGSTSAPDQLSSLMGDRDKPS